MLHLDLLTFTFRVRTSYRSWNNEMLRWLLVAELNTQQLNFRISNYSNNFTGMNQINSLCYRGRPSRQLLSLNWQVRPPAVNSNELHNQKLVTLEARLKCLDWGVSSKPIITGDGGNIPSIIRYATARDSEICIGLWTRPKWQIWIWWLKCILPSRTVHMVLHTRSNFVKGGLTRGQIFRPVLTIHTNSHY